MIPIARDNGSAVYNNILYAIQCHCNKFSGIVDKGRLKHGITSKELMSVIKVEEQLERKILYLNTYHFHI